ncbi:glycerol-3-phosphate responsive antiterminator [Evansella clarkii]|jgi:glycerol uptake operon antiterminator|uniref:glycerol-3-phosphate responsive antiterminator n=1 Tax=Evansella clarkii TaxID=79879 RepID=UPI0009975911|nr:glycerol-3-phosphate responsive antiterminator [Evansella clarkii]
MKNREIIDMVESQIIAAIKEEDHIDLAIKGTPNIAFLLTGNLFTTEQNIRKLQENSMRVFLHLDFIDGIGTSKSAMKYIAEKWKPDGIITTKNHLIKLAKNENMIAIQRIFLIDKGAISKGMEMTHNSPLDAVEVLPGIMPRVIDEMTKKIDAPIIAGGLIESEAEVLEALTAGALATSVSTPSLWNLKL